MIRSEEGLLAYESQSGEDVGNVVQSPHFSWGSEGDSNGNAGYTSLLLKGLTLRIGRLWGKSPFIWHQDIASKIKSHLMILIRKEEIWSKMVLILPLF